MTDRRDLVHSLLTDLTVAMTYAVGIVIWSFVAMAIAAVTVLGAVVRMNPRLGDWWAVRSIRSSLLRAAALLGSEQEGTATGPSPVEVTPEPAARGWRR